MIKTLAGQVKEFKKDSIITPIFMILEVIMEMIIPLLMSSIIDDGVEKGDIHHIYIIGIWMVVAAGIGLFAGIMGGKYGARASTGFARNLRQAMFENIQTFSFSNIDKFSTPSLVTRMTTDVTNLQNSYQMLLRMCVRAPFSLICAMIMSFSVNVKLSSIYLVAVIILGALLAIIIWRAMGYFTAMFKKYDDLNESVQENVSAIRVVKAYVKEDYETERFNKANDELVGIQLDVLLLLSYMTPVMNIILNLSVVAVIKVGGIQVMDGSATPGNVMAAITYCSQGLNAVMRMTMIFQTASRGVASQKRIMEVLNCEPAIKDGAYDGETIVKGKVEFRNVSFAYPGNEGASVIEDFNLVISPGETIGILGATGCGKTSLISLIPRFYDVTKGAVLVDDVDVRDYKLEVLRDKIAVSLQKSEIFTASIADNIAWGLPDATPDNIAAAADTAQAAQFINNRKDGMQTIVSQGGHSLSGGQRQRVAIARAVIKPAEILIFDDATSALDLKTEAELYSKLGKNKKDITKIIIAQRIASVKNADRIVVMDNGKLADVGSHEQLMITSSIYKDIYDSQLKK